MIAYFAKHRTASNLLTVVMLALGLMSVGRLRRATFPDFAPTEIEITYLYPGASAEEVEESICRRVEDAMDSVQYVAELRCDASEGTAVITLRMADSGDSPSFKDEIQIALEGIRGMPDGVEEPVTKELGKTELVLNLVIAGPMVPGDLKAYAEDLKNRITRLPEISTVTISGFSDHHFRVELSAESLMRHQLDVGQVADILAKQNLSLPAGTVNSGERELVLRVQERRRTARDLEEVVVLADADGAEVLLGDISTIKDTFEVEEDQIRLGDQRAALLQIQKTRVDDTIRASDAVKRFIADERDRMPGTMQYVITADMSRIVGGRLNLLYKFLWQGALLVFVMLWIFFNARLSFWVIASIPVSVSAALFLMPPLGLTIDMFTMVAVLMGLGIMMDDGIVIAENVASHVARGKTAVRAAIEGVQEVGGGIFSSFCTTACVLGPLIFLGGEIGRIMRVLPMVLLLILACSLIEAFLILPSHLAHALHSPPSQTAGIRRSLERLVDWVRENVFGKSIGFLIRWRYAWVGSSICLLSLSVALLASGMMKYESFPTPDGDLLEARIALTQGSPFAQTKATAERIASALMRVRDKGSDSSLADSPLVESHYIVFSQNADIRETGSHVATVAADLVEAENRRYSIDEIIDLWSDEIESMADVTNLVITEPIIAPTGMPIEVQLHGEDLNRLQTAAGEVREWFAQWKGVRYVSSDLRSGKAELVMQMKPGTLGLHLDTAAVARQLAGAFRGIQANEIQIGEESYDVFVALREADQNDLADLEYQFVTLPDGERVPLQSVVDIQRQRGWSRISRVNGRRTATIRGDTDSRELKTVTLFSRFRNDFLPDFQQRYTNIDISITGETGRTEETQWAIAKAGLIGTFGVFVLLSFQFRSFIQPLVVMSAIPLSFIGVVLGHLLMGFDMTTTSIFAFVSLSGVVVNDSILLVLSLKESLRDGINIQAAAQRASRMRFRAVMLTSLTTIAGLVPLLVEKSYQAEMLLPIAISIAFGLAASTVLVLSLIPCLYVILDDFGLLNSDQD